MSRAFMERFVEFVNTASEKLAHELVWPNAALYVLDHPEPKIGPSGYLETVAMMRAGFPDVQWTLEELICDGDKLAARFTMRGTHQGPFMGVPPTGKAVTMQALDIYHLKDGKIIKEYGQPDMHGLMAQIGALPHLQID